MQIFIPRLIWFFGLTYSPKICFSKIKINQSQFLTYLDMGY